MKQYKKIMALFIASAMLTGLCACSAQKESNKEQNDVSSVADTEAKEYIEKTLNLKNNEEQEWTYYTETDAWVLSVVSAVAYPELPDQQGVSVCVPGAYVTGIDTDKDDAADVTSENYTKATYGTLIIDYDAKIVSTNGQTYTASTAPIILNTGAAGYGSSMNTPAAATYAAEGYINVACGNRGKQDTATDESGNSYYTGNAPSCLVDQKNAARYIKYNILLGNLPGNVDYLVSTGGSGGGAHAAMFAATSNNADFYDYEIEAGAVGIYKLEDGSYTTIVNIDGNDYEISDGAWGCIAYSAITSLYEADMALAFEYYMDTDYEFGTSFQSQLAKYLSSAYMEYINEQNLTIAESDVGFDLNGNGNTDDMVALTIDYDLEKYPETNGYYGTYLNLYLAEFQSNLQWYLDNLDYTEGWTWFDENGNALSDNEVAAMTSEDRATAFINGQYAKGNSGGMMGDMPGGMGDMGGTPDGIPGGERPEGMNGQMPDGDLPDMQDFGNEMPKGKKPDKMNGGMGDNEKVAENSSGDKMQAGTPNAGTTQAAGSRLDSSNYSTYEEMLASYKTDIAGLEAGDKYGNNIVDLYNPLNYIGADSTENPTWVRILMGASEGDMSLFSSLNLQIAMLNSGIDADIEWQWDGGHVPSEILSESFSLYVDQMYGKYVNNNIVETPAASLQTENGAAEKMSGTDLSDWVEHSDLSNISFALSDIISYRTKGASKAIPSFDVIDYGQEDYVFGNSKQDARHWNKFLLKIFEEYADILEPLFNKG